MPVILWLRRDLRLADNPALTAAIATRKPILPVFILDPQFDAYGSAAKWRLGQSLEALGAQLQDIGSRLILRRGAALEALEGLIAETGAAGVFWNRLYDPSAKARDTAVKAALKGKGLRGESFRGHLLFEPWTVETKQGGYYKVFTPFWRAVRDLGVAPEVPAVKALQGPKIWPLSDQLGDWALGAAMNRGAEVLLPHARVGEAAAQGRLSDFLAHKVVRYKVDRDAPGIDATSGLSENLTYGEISPVACWHGGWRALNSGADQAEHFLKELVWREFAYHLMHHTPHILSDNWRDGWETFPWNRAETPEVTAWKRGHTGIPFVDAAMRQMYVTGTMHNRARMIVGSYLTKHLMTHWKVGQAWFADCLTDWDPASNAMGWQWIAGCGPDAAPYFRVFNPVTQLEKFDPSGIYAKTWIAEGQKTPPETALSYFKAVPRVWGLSPNSLYPNPIVGLAEGRTRALEAYSARQS